jgi:hypothetical protein
MRLGDVKILNIGRVWCGTAAAIAAAAIGAACGAHGDAERASLEAAARSYVQLVLALGDRDSDSLDSYYGPRAWQAEAQREHATLPHIRAVAAALTDSLNASASDDEADREERRAFLIRQLEAVVARIDVLQGARVPFDEEARRLFGLDPRGTLLTGEASQASAGNPQSAAARSELDRQLPGHGNLAARYAAFDRQFLIPPDRLASVLSRAIEGCRASTEMHMPLPAGQRVEVQYVRDLPWSAFTRYEGRFVSRVLVNEALPLTVDRALDMACHETYPGHHTIKTLIESRFGDRRPEFLVQPLFSPQSALHEAAATLAPALAFSDTARLEFERDVLFPLAGLDASSAARYITVGRLVDRLHGIEADVARRYLDGALDFPRAAAALESGALMPSAEATLKFLNQFRSYAATYTIGPARLSPVVAGSWSSYAAAVTDPGQRLPRPSR